MLLNIGNHAWSLLIFIENNKLCLLYANMFIPGKNCNGFVVWRHIP